MTLEQSRAWAATFRGARDAIAEAAAAVASTEDPEERAAAYRHARSVQRAARATLKTITWMSPDEAAVRDEALAKGEAHCDAALARLQAAIPYRDESL